MWYMYFYVLTRQLSGRCLLFYCTRSMTRSRLKHVGGAHIRKLRARGAAIGPGMYGRCTEEDPACCADRGERRDAVSGDRAGMFAGGTLDQFIRSTTNIHYKHVPAAVVSTRKRTGVPFRRIRHLTPVITPTRAH